MRFPGQLLFRLQFDRWKPSLVPGVFLLGGVLLSRSLGLLQSLEWQTLDNGPLQHLAVICHSLEKPVSPEQLSKQLRSLDREIREIGEYLHQQSLSATTSFRLGSGLTLDLAYPIHELFYEVYRDTLERDFPCFQTLKVKVRSFEPIEVPLALDRKRQLCQFLEEALCNIGKHATGVKRVSATGKIEGDRYTLTVQDNGAGNSVSIEGRGTRQCQALAKSLRGEFTRESVAPRGMVCRLTWKLREDSLGWRQFQKLWRKKGAGKSSG
jgi:two-component sensor histidine kinase